MGLASVVPLLEGAPAT